MKKEKTFADQIQDRDFLVTAEYLPKAETGGAALKAALQALQQVPGAVNVSDNPFGVGLSSLAASLLLAREGVEPVCQMVTRDRNRIALQSDLLGASALGIRNLLCLSGYHQVLTDSNQSANVYDIDSTQLLAMVNAMTSRGELLNGAKIDGAFPMLTGAVANPFLTPLELNMIRLSQKVAAGAGFIQTHAVFDVDGFKAWMSAAHDAGIADKAAILAGVFPLESAAEAEALSAKYTDFHIPAPVIDRLRSAGDAAAQKKAGIALCVETIGAVRNIPGVRGIHLLSGGKESLIPELLAAAGLVGK